MPISPYAAGLPRRPISPLGLRPKDANPSIPLTPPLGRVPQPLRTHPEQPVTGVEGSRVNDGTITTVGPKPPQNTFGPGNDLRATQVNPTPSARLTGAQGMTGQAAAGVQNFNRGAAVQGYNQTFGSQLQQSPVGFKSVGTAATMRSVNPNVQGRDINTQVQARSVYGQGMPNRTELAKQTLANLTEQSALDRTQGIRQIGQSAARFGRIGAGMTTNDLTGLEANLDRNRRFAETDLARSVAEGDIGDRFRDRDYLTGIDEGNVSRSFADREYRTGLDERNVNRDYGMAQDETALQERNIGRGINERDTELGLSERNAGRDFDSRRAALEMALGMGNAEQGDALDRFNTASGYERGIYGQEASDRDEVRGERGYQEELARYAQDQRIRQREMENAERDAEFRRGAIRSELGMAGSQQTQGQTEGAYDLLSDALRRRIATGRPGTPSLPSGNAPTLTPSITPYNPGAPRPKITVRGKGGRGF